MGGITTQRSGAERHLLISTRETWRAVVTRAFGRYFITLRAGIRSPMGAAGRFDYRPDIDGLRAVAIITVVGNHVGLPGWSGGYVGVDVFFVISGFLITSMLVTEAVQYRRIDLWAFYARRVRRLLPAFLTVLLGTLLLGAIYLGSIDGEQQGLVKSATAAVLLNANHYFWHATGGYFDRPAELQPLLHLWSLSVEEQYYLVWPLALIGLLYWKPRFDYRRKVVVTLSFIALVSFLFSLWCLSRTQSAAFYLMPARAWELAMGAVIALVPLRAPSSCSPIGIVLGYSGLAAITLAVTVYDQTTPFAGGALLLPVLGTVALIAGNKLAPNGLPARILSSKAMVGIGLISYSWYLWHWPLLAITRSVQLGGRDLLRDFLLAGIAAFVLACATYRWIEKPMRGNTRLRSLGPRANVSLGALASASCILLAASLGAWAKFDSTSSLEMKLTAAKRDRPPLHEICHNHLNQEARLPRPDQCVVSGGSKNVDAVLWGDSYAAFWMPALTEISEKDRISTYQLTRDKCPPLLEFNITHSSDPTQPRKCLEFQRMAFDEIRRLRTERGLRSVILAANWVAYSGDRMEETLGPTLDLLGGLGLRVLIIGPSPNLPYKAPECLLRHDERFCAVKKVDFYNQRARASDAIKRAINGRTDVRVLDPTSFFCDDKICPAIRDGVVMYIDTGHITATASRNFADFARAELGWLR